MKVSLAKAIVFTSFAMLLLPLASKAAAEPVTVDVDVSQPGSEISSTALGLSYETSRMLPDSNGVRYFRPDNQPLVRSFRTLGIKSLRIGGSSVDEDTIAIPSEKDIRSLFEFAKAAGVKVIYSVRLQNGDPQSSAQIAKLIHDNYMDVLDCFAIGNEPYYYETYNVYRVKWIAVRDAILAVFPGAKFCGPDQNPSPQLCAEMAHDFGGAGGHLIQIAQHSYPFGCAYNNPGEKDVTKLVPQDATAMRETMLASNAYSIYEEIRKGMADAVAGTSLSFRLTETNSIWFSGLEGASDRYASALWVVDYLHWWTAHGADGLNFHTGDRTGGAINLPCRYAAFVTSGHGYEMRPLAYGMTLFDLGGHGKVLPVNVAAAGQQNLAAYAALGKDQSVFVTLINKAHGTSATNLTVRLKLNKSLASSEAKAIFLATRSGDIAGGSADVTLGGEPIKENGSWRGHWRMLPVSDAAEGVILVTMPPASAAVISTRLR